MAEPVLYAHLRPKQFRKRLAQRPVAYLPMGTLEWHGEHMPFGTDMILSENLMVHCARRFGGIVLPPIYLGPDNSAIQEDRSQLIGMDLSNVTTPNRQLDGSCYWVSDGMFDMLIDAILSQVKRAGFSAVFADGHGPSRWAWCARLQDRQDRFGLTLIGVTCDRYDKWQSQMDHAAANETSLTMATTPALVDLAELGADRSVGPQGVAGDDPRDAAAEHGRQCLEASVKLVGQWLEDAGA